MQEEEKHVASPRAIEGHRFEIVQLVPRWDGPIYSQPRHAFFSGGDARAVHMWALCRLFRADDQHIIVGIVSGPGGKLVPAETIDGFQGYSA